MYLFLIFKYCDYKIILNVIQAVFWFQIVIAGMQLLGMDVLLNFDKATPCFMGTVFQYMRFSSLLAVMTPFLIIKNKWNIIPIAILVFFSHSSGFALAVAGGAFVYLFFTHKKYRAVLITLTIAAIVSYAIYDMDSWRAELLWGRVTVWPDIIRTWVYDTFDCPIPISKTYMQGTLNLKSVFFGRGLDTFMPIFPVLKHDWNPFPQAHSVYLQLLWEIGLTGFSLLMAYLVNLSIKLYKVKAYLLLAGLACIAINGVFAMPDRMTQTILLLVCYLALCQKKVDSVLL